MDTPHAQGSGDTLFLRYAPAFHRVDGWQLRFRQQHRAGDVVVVTRVIFEHKEDHDRRILVDVAEGTRAEDADSRLKAVTLESNVPFESGPDWLGPSSLVYPKTTPGSVHFLRSNLALWVLSCGRERLDVEPWVARILEDLEPETTTGLNSNLTLTTDSQLDDAPGAMYLRFAVPWERGDWAWWKFKAAGGTVEPAARDNRLLVWPEPGRKDIVVTGWAMEPGRETHWGRYSVHL